MLAKGRDQPLGISLKRWTKSFWDELMRYILEEPVEVGQKLRYQSGVLRLFSEHAASSMKGACLED